MGKDKTESKDREDIWESRALIEADLGNFRTKFGLYS